MPSTERDGAGFESVDWAEEPADRRRPDDRSTGLVLAFAVLAALFAYDYVVGHEELFWFVGWDPTRIGWLLLVTAVLFGRYAVVPLVANRERAARHLRAILTRPAGALSLAYLLAFGVVGLLGPETFYDSGYPRLQHRFQPPVFATFDASSVGYFECAGRLVGDSCHGTWRYPLGTTRTGGDVLELMLAGVRVAFLVAVATGTVMAVIATVVGTTAGYFRGWVDDVLMGYVNVQQTIPAIVVYIVLATMFFGNIEGVTDGGAFVFVLVFGLLDWGGIARQVRSDVLRRRSAGYVRAARAAGASDLQVIRRHVIPNSTATIVTALTRRIPLIILAQVALAWLELNRINSDSLGTTLRVGLAESHVAWTEKWWVSTFAVVVIVLTVVAFNVFGDVLRDVLDPEEEVG